VKARTILSWGILNRSCVKDIHMKMFAIFVEYSCEKNMVDVIVFGSTVGSHRISNEIYRNKFSALAALFLMSWWELSILLNCFFLFSSLKCTFTLENQVHLPMWQPSFKIFLFKYKRILIGLRGFINRFRQNKFAPKSRYGMQNRFLASSWARNYIN